MAIVCGISNKHKHVRQEMAQYVNKCVITAALFPCQQLNQPVSQLSDTWAPVSQLIRRLQEMEEPLCWITIIPDKAPLHSTLLLSHFISLCLCVCVCVYVYV